MCWSVSRRFFDESASTAIYTGLCFGKYYLKNLVAKIKFGIFAIKSLIIMDASVVKTLREYFKTKPVEKAWVFGSFSRNEEREDSDIDIMVKLSPDARMGLSYFAMICDLEDRLNRSVDMVREGQLLPFAEDSANQDRILVYERNN